MELRYCEKCGDVIRAEVDDPPSLSEHFLCERCEGGGEGSPREAPAGDENADEKLQKVELNLFSPDTIAFRKKQQREDAGSAEPRPTLRLIKPGSSAVARRGAAAAGPGAPPRAQQKMLFRCLHCRATLAIRPVEKTSKLKCPHCTKEIYITPAGKLHKTPPSSVVRKGAAGETTGTFGPPSTAAGPAGGSSRSAKAGGSTRSARAGGSSRGAPSSAASRSGTQRLSTPGSQALRKLAEEPAGPAGSRRVAKPGSTRGAASPAAPGSPSSRALRTGSTRTLRAGSAQVRTTGIPAASAKPPSAFEEHLAKEDPRKTAFITEEVTTDLTDLAARDRLGGPETDLPDVGEDALEVGPPVVGDGDESLDDLFGDDPDLIEGDDEPLFDESLRSDLPLERAERSFAARTPPRGPKARSGVLQIATTALQALFLLAFLMTPVLLNGGFSTLQAFAAGRSKGEPSILRLSVVDRVGEWGSHGLRVLMGLERP